MTRQVLISHPGPLDNLSVVLVDDGDETLYVSGEEGRGLSALIRGGVATYASSKFTSRFSSVMSASFSSSSLRLDRLASRL